MDYAYITGVELLLILVDSFSSWSEVFRVPNKKGSWIKQILRGIFSRNGIPKSLLSDNAPELIYGWRKIGCKPYKTPAISPSIEWVGRKNGADRKNGTETCSQQKEKNKSFSSKAAFKLLQVQKTS